MTNEIAREVEKLAEEFGFDKKRSIGEVAHELGVEPHVIRFWEDNFAQIKPEIGKGGRRYYYNKQIAVLRRIKKFLYEEGYTIAGLQKLLKKRKVDAYKEEDLDFIALEGDNEFEIDDFVQVEIVQNQLEGRNRDEDRNNGRNLAAKPSLSKEQREEVFSLFKNITKNLGDLKMLLRS